MAVAQPQGFLALPVNKQGGSVLVLHAWWGLNDTIKNFCKRLAEAGFIAFAPDLYHGKTAKTIPEAQALSGALENDADHARAEVTDAAGFLIERSGQHASGLAVIGFSLGAYFALELSLRNPDDIHSVVVFYGTCPGDYGEAKAAYLGHFAEHDDYEPQRNVVSLEGELKQVGRPVSFYIYPGTGHWFFEPDRPDSFNKAAADLAWQRTLAFLKRNPGS